MPGLQLLEPTLVNILSTPLLQDLVYQSILDVKYQEDPVTNEFKFSLHTSYLSQDESVYKKPAQQQQQQQTPVFEILAAPLKCESRIIYPASRSLYHSRQDAFRLKLITSPSVRIYFNAVNADADVVTERRSDTVDHVIELSSHYDLPSIEGII